MSHPPPYPPPPYGPPGPPPPADNAVSRWRRLLTRYLVATAVMLTLALVVLPASPNERLDPSVAHRVEQIRVDGTGLLTGLGRTTLRASAWLAAVTVDRQRALLDPTPLAFRIGEPLTAALHAWQDPGNRPLQLMAVFTAMALAAMTALARQQRLRFAGALLGMLLAAVAVTRPATVLAAAGFPGQVTVGVALRIIGTPDPSPLLGQASLTADKGLVAAQRQLGDAYWTAFVTANVSRADTATPILTQAPPAQRAGLLEYLRRSLVGGRDGAPGGLQRAVVGVTALVSTGVFAVVATALAMLALIAKTLLFVLVAAAVLVIPLATDRRNWRRLGRYWLVPLAGSWGLLGVSALGTWIITSAAVTLAGAGEWLISLFSGSTIAVAAAWFAWRRGRRLVARLVAAGTAAPPVPSAYGAAQDGKERAA
jgi:hypothetical protein